MTNKCQIDLRQAYLSSDFGRDLAMKKLHCTEEELKQIVGVYSKGKRKGLLKGLLTWKKVIKGGWYKTGSYDFEAGQAHGFVMPVGITLKYQIRDAWEQQTVIKDIPNETKWAALEHSLNN